MPIQSIDTNVVIQNSSHIKPKIDRDKNRKEKNPKENKEKEEKPKNLKSENTNDFDISL